MRRHPQAPEWPQDPLNPIGELDRRGGERQQRRHQDQRHQPVADEARPHHGFPRGDQRAQPEQDGTALDPAEEHIEHHGHEEQEQDWPQPSQEVAERDLRGDDHSEQEQRQKRIAAEVADHKDGDGQHGHRGNLGAGIQAMDR